MKESPMLFSGEMVRATLANMKTNTRRTQGLEHFSENDPDNWRCVRIEGDTAYFVYKNSPIELQVKCRWGGSGDRIWVREAWRTHDSADHIPPRDLPEALLIHYEANGAPHREFGKYRPPMFMPRWASRITLEITGLGVERLNDISRTDCIAEGITLHPDHHDKPDHSIYSAVQTFRDLWESINGASSWEANPWVWVIKFRRVQA